MNTAGKWPVLSLLMVLAVGAFAETPPHALTVRPQSQAPPVKVVPAAQAFTFHLNPPDGVSTVQTDKTNIVEHLGDEKKREETDETKMRVTFKKAAKGFTATMSTISSSMTEMGKKVTPPEAALMKDVVLTYHLDPAGECKTITGFETLRKNMLQRIEYQRVAQHKPQQPKLANAYIDQMIAGMIKQRTGEWHDEFTRFCGKTAKIGDSWHDSAPSRLPFVGTIALHRTITFAERAIVNGHNCVRVKYLTTTDPKEIQAAIKTELAREKKIAAAQHIKDEYATVKDITVRQERVRVIDPATMLVYSESYADTQTIVVHRPKEGNVTAVTNEKRETTYEYK